MEGISPRADQFRVHSSKTGANGYYNRKQIKFAIFVGLVYFDSRIHHWVTPIQRSKLESHLMVAGLLV